MDSSSFAVLLEDYLQLTEDKETTFKNRQTNKPNE